MHFSMLVRVRNSPESSSLSQRMVGMGGGGQELSHLKKIMFITHCDFDMGVVESH